MSHISNKHSEDFLEAQVFCAEIFFDTPSKIETGWVELIPFLCSMILLDKLINQVSTTSQHKLQLKDFKQQPFEGKLLIFEILS